MRLKRKETFTIFITIKSTIDSFTCDSSCAGCSSLNYYYFESGGTNTEDSYIIDEPATVKAIS